MTDFNNFGSVFTKSSSSLMKQPLGTHSNSNGEILGRNLPLYQSWTNRRRTSSYENKYSMFTWKNFDRRDDFSYHESNDEYLNYASRSKNKDYHRKTYSTRDYSNFSYYDYRKKNDYYNRKEDWNDRYSNHSYRRWDDHYIRKEARITHRSRSPLRSSKDVTLVNDDSSSLVKKVRSVHDDHNNVRSKRSQEYFYPVTKQISKEIVGHIQCPVCSSYYPDNESSGHQHLSQHKDRVFTVSLPSTASYTSIEQVIIHFLNLGVSKDELQAKIKTYNLVTWPLDLRGYSCSKCKLLDTNHFKIFKKHMKEDCNVLDKYDQLHYLINFCRCCHEKFETRSELDRHIEIDKNCWPSSLAINRLYDISKQQQKKKDEDKNKSAEEIKKEKVDALGATKLKLEMTELLLLEKQLFAGNMQSPSFSPIANRDNSTPAAIPPPSSPIISPSFSPLLPSRDPRKAVRRNQSISSLQPSSLEDSIYAPLSPSRPPPITPDAPLRNMFSWSPPPTTPPPVSDPSLAELVSRELFGLNNVAAVVTVDDDKCVQSHCCWTDSHTNQCQKQAIINR